MIGVVSVIRAALRCVWQVPARCVSTARRGASAGAYGPPSSVDALGARGTDAGASTSAAVTSGRRCREAYWARLRAAATLPGARPSDYGTSGTNSPCGIRS
jgi:hypothetical protein